MGRIKITFNTRFNPIILVIVIELLGPLVNAHQEEYLNWSVKQVEQIGKSMRVSGRVGSMFGSRGLSTDRAINYKLRATWLSPEVIRATARLDQLRQRLSEEQVKALVTEADVPEFTVILVELDPNEGSGVIPLDWVAFFQPKGLTPGQQGSTLGINSHKLRDVRALSGVFERNYDYQRDRLNAINLATASSPREPVPRSSSSEATK